MYIESIKNRNNCLFSNNNFPTLTRISKSFNNPNWYRSNHVHSQETELAFIAKGKATFFINQKPFHVQKGDILVIEKGFIHSTISDSFDPSDIFSCSITDYQIQGFEKNCLLRSSDVYPVIHSGIHEKYILACWKELQHYHACNDPVSDSICNMITNSIAGIYYSLFLEQTKTYNVPAPHFTQDILIYIYDHFCENITLEHLSTIFHMSTGHISHEFSKVFGISPINYAINLKLEHAKWLLVQSDLSIKQIAEKVGYHNLQHFTNIFQKRNGKTPLEFREIYTQETKITDFK